MKILAASLFIGMFSTCVPAQSSVTLYGIVDAGITRTGGGRSSNATGAGTSAVQAYNGGSAWLLTTGNQNGSRLGFRGVEDLGGGTKALFTIEMGIQMDTGASDQGGIPFGRQAFVGLETAYGQFLLGRQYSPYWDVIAVLDPFGTGHAPRIQNEFPAAGYTRVNNALRWNSPNWNGWSSQAMYAFGEQAGDSRAGESIGLSMGYGSGPLTAKLVHHRGNTSFVPATAADAKFRSTLAGLTYDFSVVKAFLAVDTNTTSNIATGARMQYSRDLMIGAQLPIGAGTVIASYIRRDNRLRASWDARQYGLGYVHNLSKRTTLYASIGFIDTEAGSGLKVPNAPPVPSSAQVINGADAPKRETTIGIRHAF